MRRDFLRCSCGDGNLPSEAYAETVRATREWAWAWSWL